MPHEFTFIGRIVVHLSDLPDFPFIFAISVWAEHHSQRPNS